MVNFFDWTEEEEQQYKRENDICKQEFESLNIKLYDNIIEQDMYVFISSLEHYTKSFGASKLLNEYITVDKLKSLSKVKRCYALGYSLYLCNKYNLKKPEYIDTFKDEKLDKVLFSNCMIHEYNIGLYKEILDAYKNAIEELKVYNIYYKEIEVAV